MEKHACGHVPGLLSAEKNRRELDRRYEAEYPLFRKGQYYFSEQPGQIAARDGPVYPGDGEPAAAPGEDRGAQRNGILQKERFQDSPWVGRFLRPGANEPRPRYPGRDPGARV